MEATKINRSSWHCKIANLGGHQNWKDSDICQYTRDFLLGVALLVFGTIVCFLLFSIVCIFTGVMIYDIFAFFVYGADLSEIGTFGLIVWSIFILAVTYWSWLNDRIYFWPKRSYKYEEPKEPKEPGFLKLAYRAHKEKYCHRITTVY